MRQHHEAFQRRGAAVLMVCPEGAGEVRRYWEQERLPFRGLSDPNHTVAGLYGQEVSLLRLGRVPSVFLIDAAGKIRYVHYAVWMSDIPSEETLLSVLDRLTKEDAP